MSIKRRNFIFLILSLFIVGCNNEKENILTNESIQNSSTEIIIDKSDEIIDNGQPSVNEDNSLFSNEEKQYTLFSKKIKLYINPSVQYDNPFADNLGNEGEHMNIISSKLSDLIKENTNIKVYCNNSMPGKSLSKSIKESNNLAVDYHLALHSNAGGGSGSEGWYSKSSYGFTKHIIDSLQDVLPYKTRGLKDGSKTLYELKATNATASLIEILFHDDSKQAHFIVNNYDKIAEAIYNGLINYFEKYE